MDVKDVIALAKRYVADVLSDEGVSNIGLEAVEYAEGVKHWIVTVGFSRRWDLHASNAASMLAGLGGAPRRTFKVLSITDDGRVLSMRDRERQDANG